MIFEPDFIPAILNGTKTMTTRIAKASQEVPNWLANARHAIGYPISPIVGYPERTLTGRYRKNGRYAVQPGRGKPAVAYIIIVNAWYAPYPGDWHYQMSQSHYIGGRRTTYECEGFQSYDELKVAYEQIYGSGTFEQPAWVYEFRLEPS